MSRIFEALQRSEAERSGEPESASVAMATDLLHAAERGLFEPGSSKRESRFEPGGSDIGARPELGRFSSLGVTVAPDSRLMCLTQPESLGAEKFRFLGVKLRQMQQARGLKKILVTSTIPEEGKSTISGNLATTLARKQSQRVLLLEGDLRRPSLSQQFGISKVPGLSEWLSEDPMPMESIYKLEGPNFWFLPAGRPPENPLELMQSGRLSELMEQLAGWFDWIVIDSPPVLPLADTSVWTRLADGVLLVTREGITQKRQLERGLQALEKAKLLGVVLNSSTNTDHKNYYQRYGPMAQKNHRR
jgi:capsular exopolysaccharide synthesis family protein